MCIADVLECKLKFKFLKITHWAQNKRTVVGQRTVGNYFFAKNWSKNDSCNKNWFTKIQCGRFSVIDLFESVYILSLEESLLLKFVCISFSFFTYRAIHKSPHSSQSASTVSHSLVFICLYRVSEIQLARTLSGSRKDDCTTFGDSVSTFLTNLNSTSLSWRNFPKKYWERLCIIRNHIYK